MREIIERDGFAVVRALLDASAARHFLAASHRLLNLQTFVDRHARWSSGSLVSLWKDPEFATLMVSPRILETFARLGFDDPRFSNGYVVSKPPHSPRTFWHQDWWAWNEEASYSSFVAQLGCLVYLHATTKENGCLRVIPGSHRRRHAMHLPVTEEYRVRLRRGAELSLPEFGEPAGAIDVPVNTGDMVLIDARLLHATRDNTTSAPRTALVLWYLPQFTDCPERIRARIGNARIPEDWPAETQRLVSERSTTFAGAGSGAIMIPDLNPDHRLE